MHTSMRHAIREDEHWTGALGGENMLRMRENSLISIYCTFVLVELDIYYYGVACGFYNLSSTVSTISCRVPGGHVYRVGYIECRKHVRS